MEAFDHFITHHKLPLGDWIAALISILQNNAQGFFNGLSAVIHFFVNGLSHLMEAVPIPIMILIFMLIVLLMRRSWKLTVFVGLACLLILNLGYWHQTLETLSLVVFATLISMVIGVPLGIAGAHRDWLFHVMHPVLDLMQTLPTFVYLIPTLILFGLGVVPGLISTIIFAIPAPIRLTHLGISSVPKPLLEAGEAFGASRAQILWKVELPSAMPTIMAGLTQCIMLSLSMVVIAALVGAAGLGVPVVEAMETVNVGKGFESGLAIVILAVILDRVCRPAEVGHAR